MPASRPFWPPRTGFTLLEMLVALGIFSLAGIAIINLMGHSVRTAALLGDRALASQVAQNLAIERITDPAAPALGRQTGSERNGGLSWAWTVDTSRTDDARLVRINIAVRGTGRAAGRTARIELVRPASTTGTSGGGA